MKKFAAATPALFCLVNLLYPAGARIARANGLEIPGQPVALFAVIAGIAITLACIWFCYSFDKKDSVRGIHVLFGIFAPTLAAVNGLCFMLTDSSFWPCILSIAMWLSSLFIPIGCNDLRLGKGFRGMLTMIPGVCVMIFAIIFMLGDSLF